jgi:ribonucleoside-diphosphate reductase alpha chain
MLQIRKRDASLVSFNPSKIYNRIKKASKGLKVNDAEIFIKVITSVPTEGIISTVELDKLVSEISASYTATHHDYSKFAASVAISSYHKETKDSFYETMKELNDEGIVNDKLIQIINDYGKENIEALIDTTKDYMFNYFAWKTLVEIYLLKNNKGIATERPQHMYMRVALWVTTSIEEAMEYYSLLSNQLVSPATPIMINSGTRIPQLSSCVLAYNHADSREGLLDTLHDISVYSSDAAGIGLCMSNIRSKESKIATSGGNAGGLLKHLKIVNESLRFFNQQGRRPGSAAIYIEPWHKDIFDFLDLKRNTGSEEMRARDLFTALWVPDNFMRAVEQDSDWYLFCPNEIKKAELKPFDVIYGDEYEKEYNKAISLGIGKKVKAQEIAKKIFESQIETGVPYILYKDTANKKTNHQNIGVVKQSNLCSEIIEYSDNFTTAICTLSSQVLKNYVKDKKFDFDQLHNTTRQIVKALNHVIDINAYSTTKGRKGGLEQRALGIGVQGFADAVFLLDLVYTSDEAKTLNKDIWETIYHAAVTESCELVKNGKYEKYSFFEGSPMAKGIFQFDMWEANEGEFSGMWDWAYLKKEVQKYGICNSLFTCAMPTASSARVTDSYEMYEPIDSNLFNRRIIGGEFIITNRYLINDLEKLGIWSEDLKNEIIMGNGSIQAINFNKFLDPEEKGYEKKVKRIEFLLQKYKTVWEISQKELISMAADRGIFIDQSQSMNIYMANPTVSKLFSSLIFSFNSGLKTGSYYTRTKAISTGAKHLAIDMTKNNSYPVFKSVETDEEKEMKELQEQIKIEMKNVTEKPSDSSIDCFGCSA